MKRRTILLLALALVFAFAGCSNDAATPTQSMETGNLPTTSTTPGEQTSTGAAGEGKVLVTYFSRVGNSAFAADVDATTSASIRRDGDTLIGNCEVIAKMVQEETGGDLFFIETTDKYPSAYEDTTAQATTEQEENARPTLASHVEDMAAYDTIVLIYPIWWGTLPQPVFTFLEEYDFSGKTILPACTNGGSSISRSEQDIAALCPDADLSDGLSIRAADSDNAKDDVLSCLSSAGLANQSQ